MTGTTPTNPAATRATACRLLTVWRGRTGSTGSRICAVGGRTSITTAIGGVEAATPSPWVPGRSPSGSPSLAARLSTRAPTSPTCFPTRNHRKAPFPGIRVAAATTWRSVPFSRRIWITGPGRPMPTGWCGRSHLSVDLGCAAVPGVSALGLGLVGRGQLAHRPLAQWTAGDRGAQGSDRRGAETAGFADFDVERVDGVIHRSCDLQSAVAARSACALAGGFRHRRAPKDHAALSSAPG
jgi:hypothetical protein